MGDLEKSQGKCLLWKWRKCQVNPKICVWEVGFEDGRQMEQIIAMYSPYLL